MKKFLTLLALAASVTTMASMNAPGSGSTSTPILAAGLLEARTCDALVKKMSHSRDADTWRNRMRVWTCRQRSAASRKAAAEAG